jgi:AcrR family transcriptional regulator
MPEASGAARGAGGARPRGREEVRQALLDAAQRLIAERGPGSVSLREIADAAGVNFGLVYQYLGTREDLLREVYQSVARRSAERMAPIGDLTDAISDMMSNPRTSTARIMAWAVLDGGYPADVLGPSPAVDHIARIIAGHATGGPPADPTVLPDPKVLPDPTEEDRLLAAFLIVTAMGWRLFSSIGLTSAGLDPAPDPARDEQVTRWMQELAALVARRPADGNSGGLGAPAG